jgi:hypothetical protein
MCDIEVTALVFQAPKSALNNSDPANKELIFVTKRVSHFDIESPLAARQSTRELRQSQFPDGSASKQLSTASFNSVEFSNGDGARHDAMGPDVALVQVYFA